MIRGWDRPTRALFALFALWACSPIVVLLIRAHSERGTFGGAFAALAPADQYHFLAWIRDAGQHLLISDKFGSGSADHIYLNPFFALSGAAWRAGASLQLAYLLWLPLAVAVLFGGFASYVRRMIDSPGWSRVGALALALFYVTPVLPLVDWGDLVSALAANDLVIAAGAGASPYWQIWGYLPTAVALGLAPLYMLGLERALAGGERSSVRRSAIWTAAAGMAVSWLHPWAGLTLLVVTAAVAAWDRFAERTLPLLAPGLALAAPLVYYALLARSDPAWGLGQLQTSLDPGPVWSPIAALAPIGIVALVGLRTPMVAVQERILVLWPVAALAVYFALDGGARLPALQGVSLPLAVLAARGWSRLRMPRALGVTALAVAALPGMVYSAQTFRDTVTGQGVPYTIGESERMALHYLARGSRHGVVLAPQGIGVTVPAFAGLRVVVASASVDQRLHGRARQLFLGGLTPDGAARMITNVGPSYLLTDCRHRADISRLVGPLGFVRRRFGCAAVYETAGRDRRPTAQRPPSPVLATQKHLEREEHPQRLTMIAAP